MGTYQELAFRYHKESENPTDPVPHGFYFMEVDPEALEINGGHLAVKLEKLMSGKVRGVGKGMLKTIEERG